MDIKDLNNIQFRCFLVQFQFLTAAQFHFVHGPALNGLLCHALRKHPLGKDIALYPVETGHIIYEKNDCYNFVVIRFGESDNFHLLLEDRLKDYAETSQEIQEAGNQPFHHYNVIKVETLPPPPYPFKQEKNDKKTETTLTLQLLTPLRMSKKIREGEIKAFDTSYFDIRQFIKLLYRRIFDLLKYNPSFKKEFSQPELPECEIISKTMLMIDDPCRKKNKSDMSFSGIMGKILLRIKMDNVWKKILWLGQFVQAGNNTSFGFGKYRICEWNNTTEVLPDRPLPVLPEQKLPLYITNQAACVRVSGESLCISYPGNEKIPKRHIPLSFISSLIITGHPRVTLPVILKLAKKGMPSFFCTKTAKVYASTPTESPDIALRVKQLTLASDEKFVLYFTKSIVGAKINNYAVLIRRQKLDDGTNSLFKKLENAVMDADTIDVIRGYEGKATYLYFNLLKGHLEPAWRFTHRKSHPPPDPVNSMLSFGYTIIYHYLTTALLAAGLEPGIGFIINKKGT
jgi:CRISPR-associated endoribonuclease Cas6